MAYPNSTGPELATKVTTYDILTSASGQHFNAKDWNAAQYLLTKMRQQLVGFPRGYVERYAAASLTAITVHTVGLLTDGRRKSTANHHMVIGGNSGVLYVYCRAGRGTAPALIKTAQTTEPIYSTTNRDIPLAKLTIRTTGSKVTVEHIRPDWAFGFGI